MSTTSILIIAHAPLAHALRACALHVFADCADSVAALDILPHQPPEESLAQARTMLDQLGADSTLLLTDLFRSTPSHMPPPLHPGPARGRGRALPPGGRGHPADAAARRELPLRASRCGGHPRCRGWRARDHAGGRQRTAEPEQPLPTSSRHEPPSAINWACTPAHRPSSPSWPAVFPATFSCAVARAASTPKPSWAGVGWPPVRAPKSKAKPAASASRRGCRPCW